MGDNSSSIHVFHKEGIAQLVRAANPEFHPIELFHNDIVTSASEDNNTEFTDGGKCDRHPPVGG